MYRVYASNLISVETLPNAKSLDELHIVLAFARDYDKGGNYQTGIFSPYFDLKTLTPRVIQNMKNRPPTMQPSVKFFLSIGGRKFPFAVSSVEEDAWIENATKSLKELVKGYHIDGIDVYYEHINPDAVHQFGKPIRKVIENLKNDNTITAASITVSAPLGTNYFNLYKGNEKLFDYVVFQTHTLPSNCSIPDDLIPIIEKQHYPKKKILAGHSDDPHDWSTVPPPVSLFAVPQLLDMGLGGISKWIVNPKDYNPE